MDTADRALKEFTTRASLTWEKTKKGTRDNIFGDNALYVQLQEKGNIERVPCDGNSFTEGIELGRNTTVKSFSYFDRFDTHTDEIITTATHTYRNVGGTISVSNQDLWENRGPAKVDNLVNKKLNNLTKSIKYQLQNMMWQVTTGNNGKDLDGVPKILAYAPSSGSYAGISRALNSTWRTTSTDCGSYGTYLKPKMENVYNAVSWHNSRPTLMIASEIGWDRYHATLIGMQQAQMYHDYSSKKLVSMGFPGLSYKGTFFTFDKDLATGVPITGESIYYINADALKLMVDSEVEFMQRGWENSHNQLAKINIIAWRGALYCSELRLNGVLHGIDA